MSDTSWNDAADFVLHNSADPAMLVGTGPYERGYRQGIRDAVRALRGQARRQSSSQRRCEQEASGDAGN